MTLDQVNSMSESERNRKIAEICGWTRIGKGLQLTYPGNAGIPPRLKSYHEDLGGDTGFYPIPNYAECLNACASMEATLTEAQYLKYEETTWDIMTEMVHDPRFGILMPKGTIRHSSPSADQRHRAFLMVMA